MLQKIKAVAGAPAAIGCYSPVVIIPPGMKLVVTSGQIALNVGESDITAEGIEAQALRALHNAKACIEAAGASLADVYQVIIQLDPKVDFKEFDQAYTRFFKEAGVEDPPTRAAGWLDKLPKGSLIEVIFYAAVAPTTCC